MLTFMMWLCLRCCEVLSSGRIVDLLLHGGRSLMDELLRSRCAWDVR